MRDEINNIFAKITESYSTPIRIGSRCESNFYYRIEDLKLKEVDFIVDFLHERLLESCQGEQPDVLINLSESIIELPKKLSSLFNNIEIINKAQLKVGNGVTAKLKNKKAILVNEVITTARSCLEAHTKATIMGANVLCWASLIDRTFGPGPVPVVAALSGEPVKLLESNF